VVSVSSVFISCFILENSVLGGRSFKGSNLGPNFGGPNFEGPIILGGRVLGGACVACCSW
jgi:hypothetical protein